MTQYSSQNPQQHNQSGRQRGDDFQGPSRWQEDSWQNREATGWDRDRDRGEYEQQRGEFGYGGYRQQPRGQNWQQEAQQGRGEQNWQQGGSYNRGGESNYGA